MSSSSISIRLPSELGTKLQAYADAIGISKSVAARQLLIQGTDKSQENSCGKDLKLLRQSQVEIAQMLTELIKVTVAVADLLNDFTHKETNHAS